MALFSVHLEYKNIIMFYVLKYQVEFNGSLKRSALFSHTYCGSVSCVLCGSHIKIQIASDIQFHKIACKKCRKTPDKES